MAKYLLSTLLVLFSLISIQKSYAVTASPDPVEYTQPDGSKINIMMRGDEHIHWAETSDGYTIMTNSGGIYVYATINSDNRMTFSDVQAHDPGKRLQSELGFLSSISKGLFFSKEQITEMKTAFKRGTNTDAPLTGGFPTTGVRKLLMILANFNNTSTTYTQSNFNNYMNQVGYNSTGSFRDYYLEVSYGLLTVNTTVTVWVVLPFAHDYYGPDVMWGDFAYDAVVAANTQAGVNYAEFDNDLNGIVDGVAIIHQGRGQEESGDPDDIWSHSWELSSAGYTTTQCTFDGVVVESYTTQPEKLGPTNMGNIGVMCHEFGHNLGAPDFYDTDYSTGGDYNGTGQWDCMANGSWNGSSGTKPAHHNAWTKSTFGWTNPTLLSGAQAVMLRNAQVYPDVVKYNTSTPNEYFIVENRQKTGFDVGIPGHGLIIYHADGDYITAHMVNNDINTTAHQGFYPMAANSTTANGIMTSSGTINSSGCPWPGTTNETTFSDASMPNSKSWAGNNTGTPLITIAENNTTKEITFCYISCTLTLTVTPPTQNVTSPAGNTPFNVVSNSLWVAVSDQSWCTVTPSGTGNGTITATYTANTISSPRTANITITVTGLPPVIVSVVQAGNVPTLAVTPPNQNIPATPAGNTTFNVSSNLAWTATSTETWCTVTPSGNGNGVITATYTVNTNTSSRIATINVTASGAPPVAVTVTQTGSTPSLSVTPSNQNVNSPAGSTTFDVTSNSSWTAITSDLWCIITPGGSGNGPLTVNYEENTITAQRIASIVVTVAGLPAQVVTVTQGGAAPFLSVTPPQQDVPPSAGTVDFNVSSNASWNAVSNASWCNVTSSGSGSGIINANYQINSTGIDRNANITVTVSGLPSQVVVVHQSFIVGIISPEAGGIKLLPNPTQGKFRIEMGNMDNTTVSIYDMSGRLILNRKCSVLQDLSFDISGNPSGIYNVRISNDVYQRVLRLILL